MSTKITAEELRRFAPRAQMEVVDKIAAGLGVSPECAVAIRLCQQAMNEWCSDEERGKVIAALFGLENHRRTHADETPA